MKAYICDQCQSHAAPSSADLAPAGWITVTYHPGYVQKHLCTPSCATRELVEENERRSKAARAELSAVRG